MYHLPDIQQYLAKADAVMAGLIDRYPLNITFEPDKPLYEDLCSSIISQQLSIKAAANIENRYLQLFGNRHPNPNDLLQTPTETLRSCGISNAKAAYLHNIAQYWLDHNLHNCPWDEKSDDEIIALLTPIKGVGQWTVQMVLMFALHRPDVLPLGDLGIKKAISNHYGLALDQKDFAEQATRIAAPWQPYRTIACRYLWKSLNNA